MSDKAEFTITTNRFRELIDNEKYKNISRAEIAKATDCDTSTITKYYNGQRQLSVDSVIKFAKYFNVSSDYLLGLSNVATTNINLKSICEYTGLDESTVNTLHYFRKSNHNNCSTMEFINKIIILAFSQRRNINQYFFELEDFKEIFPDLCEFHNANENQLSILYNKALEISDTTAALQYRIIKAFDKLFDSEELDYFNNLNFDFDKAEIQEIQKESKQNNEQ